MIKEFKRGMVLKREKGAAFTVEWIDSDGDARCSNNNGDAGCIARGNIHKYTLLPESIYEGQKWQRWLDGTCFYFTIVAISDSHVAYAAKGNLDYCITRKEFLYAFQPVLDEPEKTIEINGKQWSEATVAEALRNHAK